MLDVLTSYHNLTGLQNASNIVSVVTVANNVSGGYMVLLFVTALFLVGVVTFKNRLGEVIDAVLVSSSVSIFLTLLASLAGLINVWWVLVWVFVAALSAGYIQITRG